MQDSVMAGSPVMNTDVAMLPRGTIQSYACILVQENSSFGAETYRELSHEKLAPTPRHRNMEAQLLSWLWTSH